MAQTVTSFAELDVPPASLTAYRQGREAARIQDYPAAIEQYTAALSHSDLPPIFQARVFEHRGECYWLLSNFTAAEADYQAALTASTELDQTARAQVRLAELADFRGDYQVSAALYQEALTTGTAVNNIMVIGRARRGLGILNRRQGNTDRALNHLIQALAAFRQAGEAREQARVLTSLGRTRHARGEYHQALQAHQEAFDIFESLGDRWRMVQSLNDLGECHQFLYDINTALDYHQHALQLAHDCGADLLKPEIMRNVGVDLIELGQFDEGLDYLRRSLAEAREQERANRELEALILYNLARAYLRREQTEPAQEAVAELAALAEALDADRYRALASFARGELFYLQGNRQTAVAELNSAMLAAQTSVDRGVLWKLHATISHVIEDEAIAQIHRQIAADFIRQTAEPLPDGDLKASFVNAPPVLAVLQGAGIDPDKL
jgi:tetratricopeptide (TPR) repeat protein